MTVCKKLWWGGIILKCHVKRSLCLPCGHTYFSPIPPIPWLLKQPLLSQQKGLPLNPHGHYDLGDQLLPQSCDDLTSQMPLGTSKRSPPAHCSRETLSCCGAGGRTPTLGTCFSHVENKNSIEGCGPPRNTGREEGAVIKLPDAGAGWL